MTLFRFPVIEFFSNSLGHLYMCHFSFDGAYPPRFTHHASGSLLVPTLGLIDLYLYVSKS